VLPLGHVPFQQDAALSSGFVMCWGSVSAIAAWKCRHQGSSPGRSGEIRVACQTRKYKGILSDRSASVLRMCSLQFVTGCGSLSHRRTYVNTVEVEPMSSCTLSGCGTIAHCARWSLNIATPTMCVATGARRKSFQNMHDPTETYNPRTHRHNGLHLRCAMAWFMADALALAERNYVHR